MREILIGTSGWSYDDWVGPFYPRSMDRSRWLSHYGEHFPTVEVNFTHYQIPRSEQIASISERMTDAAIRSAIYKAPRELTHEAIPEVELDRIDDLAQTFFDRLEPAVEAGLLEGLLFQFSHTAGPDPVLPALERIEELDPPAPMFVEVRHASFNEDRHYDALRDQAEGTGGSVVTTDSPAATITRAPPADEAYFRFHGRNEEMWFEEDPPGEHGSARYDDLYSEEEIAELAERVDAAEADRVHVFFNNHVGAKAVRNALMLMDELGVDPPKERKRLEDFG